MKLNIELYLKVDFLGSGWVNKRPITGTGKRNTYGYSRLLVVLAMASVYFDFSVCAGGHIVSGDVDITDSWREQDPTDAASSLPHCVLHALCCTARG